MNSSLKYFSSFNSPNSTRLNNPLAESTAIGSPLAQQQETSFRGNQKRKQVSPLANASKHRQSMVQIEPHVLTNAQSRGIVKRLVTYYDESQGDPEKNRYMYNRVGDFPIVQLKKTEIKRNLVRSSSVRIAPPSKSVFNRDIRAAILRSNSIQLGTSVPKLVPTKMRTNDELHQIITNHEPLPPDEAAQTSKSVLDALEKNCRKRINNEELTMDRTKRVCAQEAVDGPSSREFVPIGSQSAKRGRDQTSPNQKSQGDSPNSQQSKKIRVRNNALLSSLSSSNFELVKVNSSPMKITKPIDEVEKTERKLKEATVSSPRKPSPQPVVAAKPVEKRLHLFNRKIENFEPIRRSSAFDDDDDEEIKINFVKPREKPQNYDEEAMKAAERDKLSKMLSGLSDGFKSPVKDTPKDTVDAFVQPKPAPAASISFTTTTTTSTIAPISTATSSAGVNSTSSTEAKENSAPTKSIELPKINFGINAPTTTVASLPVVVSTAPPATKTSLVFPTPTATTTAENLITFTPIVKPVVSPTVSTSSSLIAPVASTPAMTFGKELFGAVKDAPKPASSFNFGAAPTLEKTVAVTSAPLTSASSNPVPTTSAPSFNFSSSKPAFSFGLQANPVAATTAESVITPRISGITPLSDTAGSLVRTVSFMNKPETTTASGIGFSFSGGAVATTASQGFSFGATKTNTIAGNPPPATTTSSFTFGSSTNSAFGAPAAVTTASSFGLPAVTAPPSFGASTFTPAVTSPPAFGATSSTPAFGATSSTPAFGAPSTTPAFGAASTTPSFGAASTTPSFGAQTTTPSFGGTFSGFSQKTEAQPAASGMFSFTPKTTAPVSSATTSTFAFGGASQQPASFNFGQSTPAQPATTTSSGIFGRLGDKPAENKPGFSFSSQQQSAPSMFGSNSTPATTTSASLFSNSTSTFASPPSTGVFGTQSSTFGEAAKPSGMFAFGSSNNQQTQPVAPSQSAPNGMFNFGSNSTPSAPSMFGSSQGQNVSASFTFKPSTGAVSSNPSPVVFGQSQPPPSYPFGASQTTASATFNFGGASANTQSNGFNFGGAQSAPVASGGFNFQAAQPSLTPQPTPGGGLFSIGTGGGQQQRRPMRQATRRMK